LNKENPAEAKAREIAEAFLAKRFTDNGEALEYLTERVKVALEQAEQAGIEKVMLSKRRDTAIQMLR
jgi:hypothetical protein